MMGKALHPWIHFWSAIAIAITLPFAALIPVFAAFMMLNWLLEGDFKTKFTALRQHTLAWLMIAFYLLHAVGLLYTSDMKAGTFDLEVKLSFLIFPLVLASRPFDLKQNLQLAAVFVTSCLFVLTLLLIRATYLWFTLHENHFFYQAYSIWMHPSYLAMYLCMAMLLLLWLYRKNFLITRLWMLIACWTLLVFYLILLSSKMGLIVLVLLAISGIVYLIVSRRKILLAAIAMVLVILASWVIYAKVPAVSARIEAVFASLNNSKPDVTSTESSTVRILIWSEARKIIAEHPLTGVGTGDVKPALLKHYQERGITGAYEKNFNAHSAYYQIGVAFGFPGILLLLAILVFLLRNGFKRRNWLLFGFILIAAVNFLVESMLETQAGVMFFAFFASWLTFGSFTRKDAEFNP